MTQPVLQSLQDFIDATIAKSMRDEMPLKIAYDPDWQSPCYQETAAAGEPVFWQPVRQTPQSSFAMLEKAMDITLNEQFCQYFTSFWSDNLKAVAPQGQCELLQVWNDDDFARLQENLIGHLLMKQRLKQPPTLFFALTDEDDFILSVDNASGEVVLEQVGKPPIKPLAPSLEEFLRALQPV